jgi:hypothetical protein
MDDEIETFELHEEGKPYKISHRCFYFSKEVIGFIKECKYDRVYHSMFDQLIRSATSIGANVVKTDREVLRKIGKTFM